MVLKPLEIDVNCNITLCVETVASMRHGKSYFVDCQLEGSK